MSLSGSDPESLASTIEASGVLPATGMLAKYVPANLPGGLTRPVVGSLAIIEMIIGAFVASLRQLGGPLTAAAIFVGFSVWQHLRSKATELADTHRTFLA